MPRENFIGEKIDGECSKREDRGVKSEAEPYHQPVRFIKAKNLSELQLVDRTLLAQLIASLSPAFERPINDRTDYRNQARAYGQQKRPLPARLTCRTIRIKHSVRPGRRVVSRNRREARNRKIDAKGETELLALEPLRQHG